MSLIELIMAVVIASVLLGVALLFVRSIGSASKSIGMSLESGRTSIDFMAALRKELNTCRVEALSDDGSTLTYSLPIHDPDIGSSVDRNGEVIWQLTDEEGLTVRRLFTLEFVVTRLLKESSIRKDVNRDGDMEDTFDVGYLTATSETDGDRPLPRLYIVLRNGGHGGDVTGDGVQDPLFSVDPGSRELEISISRLADGESLKTLVTTCAVVENKIEEQP